MSVSPAPADLTADEAAHSALLVERIRAAMDEAGGRIGFARFMAMALYEPGSATTAPAPASSARPATSSRRRRRRRFSAVAWRHSAPRCCYRSAAATCSSSARGRAQWPPPCWPSSRHCSAGLAATAFSTQRRPARAPARDAGPCRAAPARARPLAGPPAGPPGRRRGRERGADALPGRAVRRARTGSSWSFRRWRLRPLRLDRIARDPRLSTGFERIHAESGADWPDGYCSELSAGRGSWLALRCGLARARRMLLVDYGLPRSELYAVERSPCRLLCPSGIVGTRTRWYPRPPDLTAWVDFTALAGAADCAGLRGRGIHDAGAFPHRSRPCITSGDFTTGPRGASGPLAPGHAAHASGRHGRAVPGHRAPAASVSSLRGFAFRDLAAHAVGSRWIRSRPSSWRSCRVFPSSCRSRVPAT